VVSYCEGKTYIIKESTQETHFIKITKQSAPERMKVGTGGYCAVRSFVVYTEHLVLGSEAEIAVGWICGMYGGDKYVQNFGGKIYWKVVCWKTKKEMRLY
jgi:hypothetical protein